MLWVVFALGVLLLIGAVVTMITERNRVLRQHRPVRWQLLVASILGMVLGVGVAAFGYVAASTAAPVGVHGPYSGLRSTEDRIRRGWRSTSPVPYGASTSTPQTPASTAST